MTPTPPTPLPKWWMDACRRHYGLAKQRPRGMPKPAPLWCLTEWERFDVWDDWLSRGRHPPRPKLLEHWKAPLWAWQLRKELQAKRKAAKAKPPPGPQLTELPPPSWTHPGRLVLTASEPDLANGRAGIDAIGRIIVPGVAPVWEVRDGNQPNGNLVGYIAQIEGESQYDTAFDYLVNVAGHQRAVIGTLGVDPARMLAIGVTSYMVELNAQAGWEPYGDREKLVWQAHHEGWPHVIASYGVYGDVSLEDYAAYRNQGCPRPFAVYSADGLNDTDSWAYLATL